MRRIQLTVLLVIVVTILSCEYWFMDGVKILSFSPKDSKISNLSSVDISFTFSTEMNTDTVESSFSIQENGSDYVPGDIEWDSANTSFTFIPKENLSNKNHYLIEILTDAEDIYGNSLTEKFSHTISSSENILFPSISSISPANYESIDNTSRTISIQFSEPVDIASFYSALSISPEIPGSWVFSSNNQTVTFTPSVPYSWQTQYQVSLSTDLTDTSSNAMLSNYASSFFVGTDTQKPSVTSALSGVTSLTATTGTIVNNSSLRTQDSFTIVFSEQIDEDSLDAGILFEPSCSFTLDKSGMAGSNTLVIEPDVPFEYSTLSRLTLSTSIKDVQGNTLEDTYGYYLTFDHAENEPPSISRIAYDPDPVTTTEPVIVSNFDDMDFLNYAVQDDFFIDVLFSLNAAATTIDKQSLFDSLSFDLTNSCIDYNFLGIELSNTGNDFMAITDSSVLMQANEDVIARLYFTVQHLDTGSFSITFDEGIMDDLDNPTLTSETYTFSAVP